MMPSAASLSQMQAAAWPGQAACSCMLTCTQTCHSRLSHAVISCRWLHSLYLSLCSHAP